MSIKAARDKFYAATPGSYEANQAFKEWKEAVAAKDAEPEVTEEVTEPVAEPAKQRGRKRG